MGTLPNRQTLEDFYRDSDDAGKIVNGGANLNGNGRVPTRYGGNVRTVQRVLADIVAYPPAGWLDAFANSPLKGAPGEDADLRMITIEGVEGQTVFPNTNDPDPAKRSLSTYVTDGQTGPGSGSIGFKAKPERLVIFRNGVKLSRDTGPGGDFTCALDADGYVTSITFRTAMRGPVYAQNGDKTADGDTIEFYRNLPIGSNINTGRGRVDPMDYGAKGTASHETGLGPDDDTGPILLARQEAARTGGYVDSSYRRKFAITISTGPGCNIGTLNLGRLSTWDTGKQHGLWMPGMGGIAADGSDKQTAMNDDLIIEFVTIHAGNGASRGLWLVDPENCRINLVVGQGYGGVYGGTMPTLNNVFYGSAPLSLSCSGPDAATVHGAIGNTVDMLVWDAEHPLGGSYERTGCGFGLDLSGVADARMAQLGAVAFHRAHGGDYAGLQAYRYNEDFNLKSCDGNWGYYGLGINGACKNFDVRGRVRNNVRSISIQNDNWIGNVILEGYDYASVLALLNFFARQIRLKLTGSSTRVAGASALEALHSVQDVTLYDSDIGAEASAVGVAKAMVIASTNIERLRLLNNRFRGRASIAGVLVQSGARSDNVNTSGIPINVGTNEFPLKQDGTPDYGNGPYDHQASIPSVGIDAIGNRFEFSQQDNTPLFATYQMDGQPLRMGEIAANEATNHYFSRPISDFRESADPLYLTAQKINGNLWSPDTKGTDYDLAETIVYERSGNVGDPGTGALPGVSVGNPPATFPAGQQAFFYDQNPAAGVGITDGRAWTVAGAALSAKSSFNNGALVNVDRVGNLLNKQAGAPGGFTGRVPSTSTVASGSDAESEIILRSGSSSAIAFSDAAFDGGLDTSKEAIVVSPTGGINQYTNGGYLSYFYTLGANVDDRIAVAYLRADRRLRTTVNDIDSLEVPAQLFTAANAISLGYPIAAVGTNVIYSGPLRAAVPGLPSYGTPTIAKNGTNLVVTVPAINFGLVGLAGQVQVQLIKGGTDIGAPQTFTASNAPATVTFANTTSGNFSARVTVSGPFMGKRARVAKVTTVVGV